MAETKTLVQLHKKGDATALIYGQTVAEGVTFNDGESLQAKLSSLVNKIEIVKIGDDALVIGSDKSVTIPAFYTKGEADTTFATKDEVSAVPKFGILVVDALPTENIQNDKVYLVKTGEEEDNLYTEYIRANNKWEKLGSQKIDISGKQDALSETQMEAVNSGINATKVAKYDGYEETIGGKQEQLSEAQLNAVNSGVTAAKVSTYDGYATGKQDALTTDQLAAANSGVTAAKVTKYDGYEATINGKQAQLSDVQLNAVNSGITAAKVANYDAYATGKQDALTAAQLNAANSGIDSTKVAAYDAYATGKQDALTSDQLAAANSGVTADKVAKYDGYEGTISGLDFVEYTIIKTL